MATEATTHEEELPRWISDRPEADSDALNFDPYVRVLHRFLMHAEPPLTLSVEGEWGAGKSSFMQQLQARLDRAGQVTVDFNPWRHHAEEALWAAFMLRFIEQVSAANSPSDRLRARLELLKIRARDDWRRLVWRFGAALGVYTFLVAAIAVFGGDTLAGILGVFGLTAASGLGLFIQVRKNIIERTENQIQAYLSTADYDERVAFIERFHEDFEQILDAYVGRDGRVFVFIDDLDRCAVTKVADLVESLHLMLANDRRVVFLLGMDRDMVAGSLEAKHGDVIDTLDAEKQDVYGDRYIEKFVQIPFVIPRLTTASVEGFVSEVTNGDGAPDPEVDEYAFTEDWWLDDPLPLPPLDRLSLWVSDLRWTLGYRLRTLRRYAGVVTSVLAPWRTEFASTGFELSLGGPIRGEPEVLPPKVSGWSQDRLETMAGMVAPVLNYNPRQLKRFVNLYSLIAVMTEETRLFRPERSEGSGARLSKQRRESTVGSGTPLEQIGKFVAITLNWPRLLPDLQKNPKLLKRLTLVALRRRYWDQYRDRLGTRLRDPDTDSADEPGPVDWSSFGFDDDTVRSTERDGLPPSIDTEEELEPLLDLLLVGFYSDSAAPESIETGVTAEFDALLERAGDEFDAHVERVKAGSAADPEPPVAFYEAIGPDKLLQATGADTSYSLANEKLVRMLLEVSPRAAVGEEQYRQVLEYRRSIEANPDAPWPRVDLANLYLDLGQLRAAERQFDKALDMDSSDTYTLQNYAEFLEGQGRLDDAYDNYKKALAADTENTSIRVDYADLLLRQGRLDCAIEQYRETLWIDEDDRYVRGELADALKVVGRLDEAEHHYIRLLAADPADVFHRLSYAELLERLGRIGEAKDEYTEGLMYTSGSVFLEIGYAEFLDRQDRPTEEIEQHYRNALRSEEPLYAILNYTAFLVDRKGMSEARALYERAIRSDPGNPRLVVGYAEFLAEHRLFDAALDQFGSAATEHPESALVYASFATFLADRGRPGAAEKRFQHAIQQRHDDDVGFARAHYAIFLVERGQPVEAETQYRKAIETDPDTDDRLVLTEYASFLANRGRHAEAEHRFRAAVESNKYDPYVLTAYGSYLADRGRDTEAEGQYLKAIDYDPSEAYTRTTYANFLAARDRTQEAERQFEGVEARADPDGFYRKSFGEFLAAQDRDEEAARQFLSGLDVEPDNGPLRAAYAEFLAGRDRAPEAEEQYGIGIEAGPPDGTLLGSYAAFLLEQGDDEGAEQRYREAIEAAPGDGYLRARFAEFLDEHRDGEEAVKHYHAAVELVPANPDYHRGYAAVLDDLGRDDEAADHRATAEALEADATTG